MPELPEVETIRRHLAPLLLNKEIERVVVRRPDVVGFPDKSRFQADLRGERVCRLERKGKYLIFQLKSGKSLIIHLRLSGHLRFISKNELIDYERVRFILSDGNGVSFIDPRALGKVYLVENDGLPEGLKGLSELGIEPIERGFTPKYLKEKLKGRKRMIKSVLLDQRVCAGVGNIYSDEALFLARISPFCPAGRLSEKEIVNLTRSLRRVISDGIRHLGATIGDGRYLLPNGARGEFGSRLMVVGREGLPCRVCGGVIRRRKIGNRSCYYCPRCQKQ